MCGRPFVPYGAQELIRERVLGSEGPELKCHLEVKHQLKWHKATMPNNERDQGWEGSWRAEDDCALEGSQISLSPAVHIHSVLRNAVILSMSIYYEYWNRNLNIYDVFCMHVLFCSESLMKKKAELYRKVHFWLCPGAGSWCWWLLLSWSVCTGSYWSQRGPSTDRMGTLSFSWYWPFWPWEVK